MEGSDPNPRKIRKNLPLTSTDFSFPPITLDDFFSLPVLPTLPKSLGVAAQNYAYYESRTGAPQLNEHTRNYQTAIVRFFHPMSPLNRLMLFHQMGTGKTRTFIATLEKARVRYHRHLIILPKQDVIPTFKAELVKYDEQKYESPDIDDPDPRHHATILSHRSRKANKIYDIHTHTSFANMYKENPAFVERKYAGCYIVVDEVHRLRPETDEFLKRFQLFNNFFSRVQDAKILLLTGTPMRNDVSEIMYWLALLNPTYKLPTGDIHMYFKKNHKLNNGHFDNQEELVRLMKGKVSVLRGKFDSRQILVSNAAETFPTGKSPMYDMTLYLTRMSRQQTEAYNQAIARDKSDDNVAWKNSRRASVASRMSITTEDLRGISSKLSVVLNRLKQKTKRCFYVFVPFVTQTGGGDSIIKLLHSAGLKNAGKQPYETVARTPNERYLYLSSSSNAVSGSKADKLIKFFGSERNMYGEHIRVILGTIKVSEAFSFLNVQEIHVLSPRWTFAAMDQAVARGIRLGSLKNFTKKRKYPTVKIYYHAAIPYDYNLTMTADEIRQRANNHDPGFSVDIYTYLRGEAKDIRIKHMERLMKINALDCHLTLAQNLASTTGATDRSRGCDYLKCKYTCSGGYVDESQLIFDTYHQYFADDDVEMVKDDIRKAFRRDTTVTFEALKERRNFTPYVIFRAVHEMVHNNDPINNIHGIPSYIRVYRGMIFLVNTPSAGTDPVHVYYNRYPALQQNPMPHDSLKRGFELVLFNKSFVSSVRDLWATPLPNTTKQQKLSKHLKQFSLDIQEIALETAVASPRGNIAGTIAHAVRSIYKQAGVFSDTNGVYSKLLPKKIRVYNPDTTKWADDDPLQPQVIDDDNQLTKEGWKIWNRIITNPYKFWGIKENWDGKSTEPIKFTKTSGEKFDIIYPFNPEESMIRALMSYRIRPPESVSDIKYDGESSFAQKLRKEKLIRTDEDMRVYTYWTQQTRRSNYHTIAHYLFKTYQIKLEIKHEKYLPPYEEMSLSLKTSGKPATLVLYILNHVRLQTHEKENIMDTACLNKTFDKMVNKIRKHKKLMERLDINNIDTDATYTDVSDQDQTEAERNLCFIYSLTTGKKAVLTKIIKADLMERRLLVSGRVIGKGGTVVSFFTEHKLYVLAAWGGIFPPTDHAPKHEMTSDIQNFLQNTDTPLNREAASHAHKWAQSALHESDPEKFRILYYRFMAYYRLSGLDRKMSASKFSGILTDINRKFGAGSDPADYTNQQIEALIRWTTYKGLKSHIQKYLWRFLVEKNLVVYVKPDGVPTFSRPAC